jgi:uncharacterized membrane protein YeiH
MIWSDALGLAAFGVVGCHIALAFGVPFMIAVFMGMVTATGGIFSAGFGHRFRYSNGTAG